MKTMRGLTLIALFVVTAGNISIPCHELGLVYRNGQADATIKIDVFVNLLCRKSKERHQPLLDMVDSFTSDQVQLRIHLYPLPYHTYAFYAAKGTFVFKSLGKDPFVWMSSVYNSMADFKHDATFQLSTADVIGRFADLAESLGADRTKFKTLLAGNNHQHKKAVLEWKYGASRGVHSTPTIFVNDVLFQGANPQMPEIQELKDKISALLAH